MSESTELLQAILVTLREIRDALRTGGGAAVERQASTTASGGKGGQVAGDRELDSEYGDPTVRKDPKRWQGSSFVGCHYSECSPEYLDELANLLDWMGDKDEEDGKLYKGKPTATFKRKDAARARGWAARIRSGWKPSGQATAPAPQDDSSQNYGGAGGEDPLPF